MHEVTLDGTPRTLKFNSRAIGELELRSERHIGWFLNEFHEGRIGFAVVIWMLWAGLQHEPNPPRREDIEAIVDRLVAAGGKLVDFRVPIAMALGAFLAPPGKATPEAESPSPTSGGVTT